MNLYSVNNGEPSLDGADWRAIWADSPAEAEAYYRGRFSDECREHGEDTYTGKVEIREHDHPGIEPLKEGTHEELRIEVQRLIGWRWEEDRQCERCELYSMDMRQHRVCDVCCLCPTCRAEETGERCEACQGDKCDQCGGGGTTDNPVTGRVECVGCEGTGTTGGGDQ